MVSQFSSVTTWATMLSTVEADERAEAGAHRDRTLQRPRCAMTGKGADGAGP